jgi:hypothetical protein
MPIWKLEPQNVDSPHWQASTYQGPVMVRAASEIEARHLAAQRFGSATAARAGEDTLLNPWSQEPLVLCTRVLHTGYDDAGKEEVLEPREER